MSQLIVNGIPVEVVRKKIKHLHLSVHPPEGRVRIAVPLQMDEDAVRLAVATRQGWIQRQQAKYQEQERQTEREYVSGESHYFKGNRYLLNVIPRMGHNLVVLRSNKKIDLYVRAESTTQQRGSVMAAWYRAYLKEVIPPLIEKWEKVIGVQVAEWGIKRMKTKWGSCMIKDSRIWLNLELAKKSSNCLEYVLVHEMVHLLERKHNENFVANMNKFLPQWQLLRDELNRAPLPHETWNY